MSAVNLPAWLEQAQQQGLVPAGASRPEAARPWPVQLLTALGAWLSAVPLLIFLALLFGRLWEHGPTAYVLGLALVVGSANLLRGRSTAFFLEQLALPLLLVGLCSLGFALGRDLPFRLALVAGLAICAGLVLALPRHWLRLLLGMAAVFMCIGLLPGASWSRGAMLPLWWAVYLALAAWALAQSLVHHGGQRAEGAALAALLEPVLRGWAMGLLLALVWLSGPSFMAAGVLGSGLARELNAPVESGLSPMLWRVPAALSVLASAWAFAALLKAWPVLRLPRLLLPGLLGVALCWWLPALGGCLLLLSLALVRRRRVLALSAAAAALWVLGSFYYRLDLPLSDKALVLVVAGALLGAWLWLTRQGDPAPQPAIAPARASARWALPACALLSLCVVNGLIWQKEQLIAEGRAVYVKLAPLDPRSLIQGDYMRLNYALPPIPPVAELALPWQPRPRIAGRLDERGVLVEPRLLRAGEPAGPGQLLLELSPVNGRWTLVSDAWYFQEGQEPKFRAASHGEFRVLPDGRALLVGLVGPDLRRVP
ncbi:GDYXXLXY domain-containing protein [Paucibacter sp. JuS9]|uniref:GDYXXLXY domain-containing protein n=1 Tax=Paucibacter sp. JuS9 TaxID=3228748 RepID=UPI0037574FD0